MSLVFSAAGASGENFSNHRKPNKLYQGCETHTVTLTRTQLPPVEPFQGPRQIWQWHRRHPEGMSTDPESPENLTRRTLASANSLHDDTRDVVNTL